MTEQQACTLCGAGGHLAAQCIWKGNEKALALAQEIDRRRVEQAQEPVTAVSEETFSSDGTSDIITCNLPIGTKLYAVPVAQTGQEPGVLRNALEQAYMALIGYLPTHRNAVTDAAIEAARAALSQPHANRQWSDFDDWLVWELESDSNQQFEYPACAIQLARRAFKCAQLQPASELEQSANFLAEERDIAQMIAVGMAHILKAISKNRNAVVPPEVHQSISEVLDIYGVHFPAHTAGAGI